jgi:phenylacetic acid degradation protein paaN
MSLLDQHRATLDGALAAIAKRDYWTPYPEAPSGKIYGETASADAKARFEAQLGKPFALDQPATTRAGAERSPFGFALDIGYPQQTVDELIERARGTVADWRKAGVATRVGICLEILHRINRASFDIAYAAMHTTGQPFVMAFQAAGPHAQDRGLEAVAMAYAEMARTPAEARWEKPAGKGDPLRMQKTFTIVPRGIGLVIGCSTFPTWNGYPGIFADLATGNPVIVKPHPAAILPLAITVRIARTVLKEQGIDPDVIQLAVDTPNAPLAQTLALRPEIALIDYTGSSAFGDWLAKNAGHAQLFAEKAGVNPVMVDSTADAKGMFQNLAFSLSLYSGQMCTTPQNIFVPRSGIKTEAGALSFDEFAKTLAGAVDKLLADPARAVEFLGAIQNPATLKRLESAAEQGEVVLASKALAHPQFAEATVRTPLLVKADRDKPEIWTHEMFGPIAYVIAVDSIADGLACGLGTARRKGAITASVYSTDRGVLDQAVEMAAEAGVALSCNLTGGVFVNQSAAFSDFHATAANPASTASLTDAAFVASRFHVVQSRIPAAA